MKSLIIFLFFIGTFLYSSITLAQSEEYVIESFQGEYNELTEYESMVKIFLGDPLWEFEFELDFQFPFYGEYYDRLIYLSEAWGAVTDNEDLAFFLMDFSRGYAYDNPKDTVNIPSDVRFSHVQANSMQAFVIQYTKNRFFADPNSDEYDTNMNFQLWFFENGVLEVHFGEMHMDENPIYSPGKGFFCYTTDGGVDTSEVCGPHMGISNPYDEEDGIALSGSYYDYEVTGDIYDILTVLPPKGWIIRFKPKSVGIFDPKPRDNQIAISPNPASSFINIPEIGSFVTMYDFSGRILYEGITNENKLNVSDYPSGIYCVKITSGGSSSVGKFYKS